MPKKPKSAAKHAKKVDKLARKIVKKIVKDAKKMCDRIADAHGYDRKEFRAAIGARLKVLWSSKEFAAMKEFAATRELD